MKLFPSPDDEILRAFVFFLAIGAVALCASGAVIYALVKYLLGSL